MKISLPNIEYKNHNLQKIQEQKASNFIASKNITSSLQTLSNYNKANISFKSNLEDFYKRQDALVEALKEESDDYDFSEWDRHYIQEALTEDNIDIAEKLCFGKDEEGNALFEPKEEIRFLLKRINHRNVDLAEKICFLKDEKGENLFLNLGIIKSILEDAEYEPKVKKFVNKILFEKDDKGNYIFPHREFIPEILTHTKHFNVDEIERLCFDKNTINNPERLACVAPIVNYANEDLGIADSIYKLYFLTDENGEDIVKNKRILSSIGIPHLAFPAQDMKEELKAFFDASSDFDTHTIKSKQNNAGYEFIATKTQKVNPKDNFDKTYVTKKVMSNDKGELIKTTIIHNDKQDLTSWIEGSNKSVIIKTKYGGTKFKEILYQIEIINDENNEPNHIIVTKPSNKISGTFDVTKYNLSDYSEDMDILKAIRDNTITNGEKLSYTEEQENRTIVHKQTFTNNGITTNKTYWHKYDEEYEMQSKGISYEITDEAGKKILKTDRSLTINPDGTTTTIVNGKKYTAKFDDETFKIEVENPNNEKTIIDLEQKCPWHSKEKIFNFAKSMFADLLIPLQYCPEIVVRDGDMSSSVDKELNLKVQLNDATMSHEIGHIVNMVYNNENWEYLHQDCDLIKIYNEEFDNFRKQNPRVMTQVLDYFSQISGGSRDTGLDELIAEAVALLTSLKDKNPNTQLRKEYLLRYFPKTITKVADLYGYNAINN